MPGMQETSVVHIHARDQNGIATSDPEVFKEIDRCIREKGCDIIIQHSTSPGRKTGARIEDGARSLEANPEMGSADIGVSVVMRKGQELINLWTRSFVDGLLKTMLEKGIKPELEVYTHGGLEEVDVAIEKGLLEKPYWINFVMDMHRTAQNVVRFNPKILMHLVELLPADSCFRPWALEQLNSQLLFSPFSWEGMRGLVSKIIFIIEEAYWPKAMPNWLRGSLPSGEELGREPATPDETRALLGVGRYHK